MDEARSLLSETANILAVLAERLANRDSAYAAVFTAILSIIGEVTVVSDTSADAAEPNDLAALDAAWEETAVSFGPGDAADGCSVDRLRIQIRAGRRDVRSQ